MNRTTRKAGSAIAAGGIGLLLSVAGLGLAPAAQADDGPRPLSLSLSAPAPADLGLAGEPVEYTDTVTNTGSETTDELAVHFTLDGGSGLPPNAASLEYRTADGVWKPVPLDFAASTFSGTLPETFTLAPGATHSVRLRIGLPMGTPHHGDTNGGTQSLKVHTTVGRVAAGAAAAIDDHVITVDGLSPTLSGVPASVTAGGATITFDAKVSNPTSSAYVNLSHFLVTDTFAIVEVNHSGHWTRLTGAVSPSEPTLVAFVLDGKDSSMAAHSDTVTKVRLSYSTMAAGVQAKVGDCVSVNVGADPFSGTGMCGPQASIAVKASAGSGGSATPTATPTVTLTPTVTPSATATPDTSAQLAETGGGGMSAVAVGAGALVLAGAAALSVSARRRRSHH